MFEMPWTLSGVKVYTVRMAIKILTENFIRIANSNVSSKNSLNRKFLDETK